MYQSKFNVYNWEDKIYAIYRWFSEDETLINELVWRVKIHLGITF